MKDGQHIRTLTCGICRRRLGATRFVRDIGIAHVVREDVRVEGAKLVKVGNGRHEWRCPEHVETQKEPAR